MFVEDMSRNKCYFQVRISYVLRFVSMCDRPSDRRMSAKLVPTFADRGCRVVSAADPHGRILGFLDRSRYFSIQVAPQLYT
jgi:hypothetical protein